MKKLSWILACTIVALGSHVRAQDDTVKTKRLDEVTIHGYGLDDRGSLPDVDGTRVWTGKKTEVINVQNLDANISEKTARQIFAKVPGVFVYDMDGPRNQVNIATRGLDPHRFETVISAGSFGLISHPGPGVWSSDGRSVVATIGFKI